MLAAEMEAKVETLLPLRKTKGGGTFFLAEYLLFFISRKARTKVLRSTTSKYEYFEVDYFKYLKYLKLR